MVKLPSSSSSSPYTSMESYVTALEEEKKKILVFERELPFSLHLVTQAIEICRSQLGSEDKKKVEEEAVPVLEEFIPLRPSNSSSSSASEQEEDDKDQIEKKKPAAEDWLRSVQLWKQPESPKPRETRDVIAKPVAVKVGSGGAFHVFEKEKSVVAVPESSTTTESSHGKKEKGGGGRSSLERKSRRCWSPELHRRFLNALKQLGGSHAATPKQIRELMKVDGLTNDEVKSHLQKYRIHNKRASGDATENSSNSDAKTPQIVLVSGLWMPSSAYASSQPMADSTGTPSLSANYASGTAPPSELVSEHLHNNKHALSMGGRNSDSSATTSSSSSLNT